MGLGRWDRLTSRLGQAPFPGPGSPPSPSCSFPPWFSFVLKIEGAALGAEASPAALVSVAFHSLQGHDTHIMSSFFKVLQKPRLSETICPQQPAQFSTVLRTTLGQPLLRRASRGPGVVPRKEGGPEQLPGASFVGQICVLASQTFRKAQNHWGSRPLRAGRAQPVPGQECSYKPWGQGAPWRPRPERALTAGYKHSPPLTTTLLDGRSIVWKEQGKAPRVKQQDSFGAGSLSWPFACLFCA